MIGTRRSLLAAGTAAATLPFLNAYAAAPWDQGAVAHLLPAASASEFLIKASFREALTGPVRLMVDGASYTGERTDTEGRFWRFRASGLQPGRTYQLQLKAGRRALCDPWPLATFPAADAEVASFRLLSFTCAGGLPGARGPRGVESFRDLAVRQRLLNRALSFAPDAAVAIGDHIYWDQRSWIEHPNAEIRALTKESYDRLGYLDHTLPLLGTDNEPIVKRVVGPQIADLYGVMMRSTPMYFVGDDHDYFENDEANDRMVTFPPDDHQIRAYRAVQRLYYPEFLPDPTRPAALSGASAADNGPGVSEAFGTIRAGGLFEAAIYDCGRFLSLKGVHAGLIPPDAEAWLLARTRAEAASRHFVHIPSHPMGWTAGKWREWYPDVVASVGSGEVIATTHGSAGKLTTSQPKFLWQSGWAGQHQRIAAALSAQKSRAAVMVSGDLHASGHGRIVRSGDLDLAANPIHTILSGSPGASESGWPTFARGTLPEAPAMLTLEGPAPLEKNGFTIIDVTPERMVMKVFAWREPDPITAIDTLQPYAEVVIPRRA